MKPAQRITKNTGLLLASRFIDFASRGFILALIARYLTLEDFGKFGLIKNLVNIFLPLTNFGLSLILIREIAKNKNEISSYLGSVIVIKSLLSVGIVIVIAFFAFQIETLSDLLLPISIETASILILSFSTAFLAVFSAIEKMESHIMFSTLLQVFTILFLFITYKNDLGLLGVFIASGLATLVVTTVLILFSYKKLIYPKFSYSPDLWKFIIKESYSIGISAFLLQAILRIDVLMIGYFKTTSDIGLFHGPVRLMTFIAIIPHSVMVALMPSLSRIAVTDREIMKTIYKILLKFLVMVIAPFAILLSIFSADIILLVFGSKFQDSIPVMQLLSFALLFLFLVTFLRFMLIALNKQVCILKPSIFSLLFKILASLILIPLYGINGAAIGTIVTYFVFFIFVYHYVSISLGRGEISSVLLKTTIATGFSTLCFLIIKNYYPNVILTSSIFLITYLAVLILQKPVSRDDIRGFKDILRKRGGKGKAQDVAPL